jgi:tRNA(His) 5'-end guanylyltransferase
MDKTSLGDRMKMYESVSRNTLVRRMPVILRVDGRAFHTFTKAAKFERPFDGLMSVCMENVAFGLVREIQGAKLAYVQSDEVSVLITDYDTIATEAWFANGIQKMVSVAASIATTSFIRGLMFNSNQHRDLLTKPLGIKWPQFDARIFNLPKEEVCNYFIWRQQDATRNSISMLAQTHFNHKQLHGKSSAEMQDMLFKEVGVNWNDLDTDRKRGLCVLKDCRVDREIPIFKQDRNYIEINI